MKLLLKMHIMLMYNLIEYSDNYSDTSGSLWQFKRDEQPIDNNGASINLTAENSSSFKYKSNFIGDTVADEANRKKEGVKIAVPLKYLSNFWRSLEMSLTLFRMGKGQKGRPTSFSPATSNVRISPQNLLTFSFNSFDRLV